VLSSGGRSSLCTDLDRALERAEEELLANRRETAGQMPQLQHLANHGLPEGLFVELITCRDWMRSRQKAGGEWREQAAQNYASRFVGEVGFSLGEKRTADVVAEMPTTAHCLPASQISGLASTAPHLAVAIYKLVSRSLAEKVVAANRMTEQMG
jgi:hypothetical protein